MRAHAYIRFSTPKQEKGDSLRRQTDDVAGFCDRQGWTIVETIQDLGQSAWTGAHLSSGELGLFADRVRRGEIKMPAVLVVEKLDRLSRQEPRKTLRWLEDLCEKGLSIATVDGGRVYTDASLRADLMGTFEILMRAQLAHQESEQKSQRVLGAIGARMERAQTTGQKITAKAPGWLTLNPDRMGFSVDQKRADLVRSVYEMAAAGQGARWIAKTLNEQGQPAWGPARADGKPRTWEISSVKLMLAQPSVEGDYEPGFSNTSKRRTKFSERIIGYYPRIVDADLVARARAAVEGRRTGPRSGGRHTANVANLFAGLIRCGTCGNRMHLRSNGEKLPKRYLHCNHASRSRGCDQKQMFAYDPLEAAVLDQILHLALDDRHFARPDETGALSIALAEIEKAVEDRKAVSRRLVRLAAMTDDEDPAIVTELNENRKALIHLENRRAKVSAQLDAARGAVSPEEHLERVRDLRGALEVADPVMRQAARLRVQTAMNALGVNLACRATPTGRETVLSLPTGLVSRISHDGAVVMHADLTKVLSRDLVGVPLEDAARRVAHRLDKAEAKIGHWDRGEAAGASAVEQHMRRQRQRDAKLAA